MFNVMNYLDASIEVSKETPFPSIPFPLSGGKGSRVRMIFSCPRYGGRCHNVTEGGFYPDASIEEFF